MCKAIAIVFDAAVQSPKAHRHCDAIQSRLDHKKGYSTEIFCPYTIIAPGIAYEEIFAQGGPIAIGFFGRPTTPIPSGKRASITSDAPPL
jgi:hypothetical protein